MSKELIQKELDKLLPNREQDLAKYRKYLVAKYGEEEMQKIEVRSEIVGECLSRMMNDLL